MTRYVFSLFLLLAMTLLAPELGVSQVPAFPGAEGYGSDAKGGRGGQLIRVTNLNNDGPGSLREALAAEGPRMILFEVGGTIDLTEPLEIRHPYVTLAGESAPSPGISLRGHELSIRTSEVIVRHMRFRPGDHLPREAVDWGALDAVSIRSDHPDESPVERVILDHCSFSWGTDEVISIWHNARDVTIQHAIISEGLRYHPWNEESNGQGLLIGSNATNISVLRSLFIHNFERNPYMNANGRLDFRNNVIYNGGFRIMRFFNAHGTPQEVNLVNNQIIAGPESRYRHEISIRRTSRTRIYNGSIFLEGNVSTRLPESQSDNWQMVRDEENLTPFPESAQSDTPFPVHRTSTLPVDALLPDLADHFGATQPERDPVDRRLLLELETHQGEFPSQTAQAMGWPHSTPSERSLESLFAWWSSVSDVDLTDPDRHSSLTDRGYTHLEEMLHHLAEEGGGAPMNSALGATEVPTGIESAYPNPFRDRVTFLLSVAQTGSYELELFDTIGRRVYRMERRTLVPGQYEVTWSTNRLAGGVYIARLRSEEGQWIRKVVRLP